MSVNDADASAVTLGKVGKCFRSASLMAAICALLRVHFHVELQP